MKPAAVIQALLAHYPPDQHAEALTQMIQDFAEDYAVVAGRGAARAELREIARRIENGEL